MAKSLYITATADRSGKSAVVLGFMQMLLGYRHKVAFFRPIINDTVDGVPDHDINLVLKHFNLDIPYRQTYAYTLKKARELINSGHEALLLENILNKFKELEAEYDFVLCEGTDFLGKDPAFEFDLNAQIASNMGCPVVLVACGRHKTADELVDSVLHTIDSMKEQSLELVACIANRVEKKQTQNINDTLSQKIKESTNAPVFSIPEESALGNPTIKEVCAWLDGVILHGHPGIENQVSDYVIAAMHIGNFLEYLKEGMLVLTPGDREDIILASLASRQSMAYPNISGILLSGGLKPSSTVEKLITGWAGSPVPIISCTHHTYKTTTMLSELYGRIGPEDTRKIDAALSNFEAYVHVDQVRARLGQSKPTTVTPKMFEYTLVEQSRSKLMHIVLPEGSSKRILQAADVITRRRVARLTLIGKEENISKQVAEMGLDIYGADIIDPTDNEFLDEFSSAYYEMRKHKGIRMEEARDRMQDPTYFATMMVQKEYADGMVSGAEHTTAQTIRPAFEFIRTKPGSSIVSSVFFMCMKDRVHVYGDCAVNPNPSAEQLAEIAIQSAETARVFGVEPRVAMLSYSTGGSGSGEDVDIVKQATGIAREKAEESFPIEGPIQFDAAVDPDVAATKMPESRVAGKATIFIFPDLNTGNNTYKAVQRSSGAVAIGPVLQGLNKPINDLSRGCTVPDIVNTVAITAIQAQAEKGLI